MQAQLQVLAEREVERGVVVAKSTKVVRLQVFNKTSSKISGFVTAYKLYIRIKIREVAVEEQI